MVAANSGGSEINVAVRTVQVTDNNPSCMTHTHHLSTNSENNGLPHVLDERCWCNPTKESYRDISQD